MTASYYIYYKVKPEQSADIRSAVIELQRSLAEKTGVTGRLLCRRDQPDTWMEVYENVGDAEAFEALLASELERLKFRERLGARSPRQLEVFRAL